MDSEVAIYANVGGGRPKDRVAFKKVHLYKEQTLGIGSYGKVCKAKCDDLVCAAKVMHETLFDPTVSHLLAARKEHRLPIKRFEQECEFLSALRHPNIIQYLNVYIDPDTGLPALLMELMDSNLTSFLENSSQPIAYHVQVNICHDVALALSFLHSNDIIHRDLSSNNVLLIGHARAKVTDFGMARLGELSSKISDITYTMCPGTDAYMPPEAVKEQPEYSKKIDCFSYGVIVLQILTREFPRPSNRRREIEVNHPGLPSGTLEIRVSEIERRENHISKVKPGHPLLRVALDCLNDKDVKRPFAHELCERVAALKEGADYSNSEKPVELEREAGKKIEGLADEVEGDKGQPSRLDAEVESLKRVIYMQNNQLEEKEHCIMKKDRNMAATEDELQEVRGQCQQLELRLAQYQEEVSSNHHELRRLDALIQTKDDVINDHDRQLRVQEEISEQVISQFEDRVHELEQQLMSLEDHQKSTRGTDRLPARERDTHTPTEREESVHVAGAPGESDFKLKWREGPKAPYRMSSFYNAVVDCNTMYIKPGGKEVYECRDGKEWSQLPNCPMSNCPLVMINKRLTIVGGSRREAYSNMLYSLVGERGVARKKWAEEFPPMPTKRSNATAVSVGTSLVVAGGQGKAVPVMSTVEVMNTWTHQWSTAASLPEPMWAGSVAVCGDCIYMLGEKEKNRSVFACSLSALLHSCKASRSSTLYRRRSKAASKEGGGVWRRLPHLPVMWSAAVTMNDHLLLVGGMSEENRPISDIHLYSAISDAWEVIGHTSTARQQCFVAVLHDNQLVVVGGVTDSGGTTDTVEIATVVK